MCTEAERLQLVDFHGRPTGAAPRPACHQNPGLVHHVVHVVVRNHARNMLLQFRHPDKDLYPNRWDTAVGGHVQAGESLRDALHRELAEELGVAVPNQGLEHAYAYLHGSDRETEYVDTCSLVLDGPFRPDPTEVKALRFWSLGAIRAHLGTGVFTPNFEDEFSRFMAWLQAREGPGRAHGQGEEHGPR